MEHHYQKTSNATDPENPSPSYNNLLSLLLKARQRKSHKRGYFQGLVILDRAGAVRPDLCHVLHDPEEEGLEDHPGKHIIMPTGSFIRELMIKKKSALI